jgi:HK97 family phage portal protein
LGVWNVLSKKARGTVRKMFQGYYSQVLMIPPALNTQDYLIQYGKIGWLFACTSKIANDVADAEWKAYRKGEEDPLKSSKALDLLLNPNPFFDTFTTLELTQMYMDLVGKCFWYIAKDRAGRPSQIWVISPLNMTIIPDKDNYIQGYIYQAGAQRVPLSTDEVIMFKYQDPNNPYDGVSPANAAAVPLESDKFAATWNRNFFYNNAEPQGIVSFPDGVEEDDFQAWMEKWNDKYGGVGNAKKTAFIRGGQVSYTAIQISQKDMDFYNLRMSNRDEILGIFGVPKSILGIVEDVNRANAEASEYTYMKHTISSRVKRFQNKLNNEFVPLFGEEDVELRSNNVVPEDKEFIKSVVDSQTDKSITKNEARNILNKLLGLKLEPLDGGDVIYQPVSQQPMGTALPTVNSNKEPPQDPQKRIKKKEKMLKLKSKFANIDKEAYWKAFVNKTDEWEKEFKPVWEAIFEHQKEQIISSIKSHKSVKALSEDDLLKFLLGKGEAEYIVGKMLPVLKKIIEDKGKQVMDELETNISFDLHNPMVTDWLSEYCGTQIHDINSTTESLIREQLKQGEEAGESVPELGDRISQYFDNMEGYRVPRIVRTEVIGASNNAALMGYKQSEVVDKKEWLTAIDGRERDWHREANGQVVDLENKFTVHGEDMDCPGDGGASADNVVNCRCTIMPSFD